MTHDYPMNFQKQRYMHDPDNGEYGDCFRTAIACLLCLDREEVPHFYDGVDDATWTPELGVIIDKRILDWLRSRGLKMIEIEFPGETALDSVLFTANAWTRGMPYILGGLSRTGVNHVVVAQGEKIVWDTSIVDSGIVGPQKHGNWSIILVVGDLGRLQE